MIQTRKEYVDWSKQRALEYVNQNDMPGAIASITSDLMKNKETSNHMAIGVIMPMYLGGQLSTQEQMKEFIEGIG